MNFQPRDTNYLVELLEPEKQTAGGIYLPETCQENWEDGIIWKAGPGFAVPLRNGGFFSGVWCEPGERILFHQKDYRPFFTGSRHGVVADESVICIIAGDKIYPANDWVLLEPAGFEENAGTDGRIALPEELQSRPNCGTILDWGPGTLRRTGRWAGYRKTVGQILNVDLMRDLFLQWAWWTGPEDAYEVGSDAVQGVLVRAENLLFIEKE